MIALTRTNLAYLCASVCLSQTVEIYLCVSWASLIASLSVYVCSHSSVHLCTLSQHAAHVVCVLVKCIMFYMCCEYMYGDCEGVFVQRCVSVILILNGDNIRHSGYFNAIELSPRTAASKMIKLLN